MKVKKKIIEKLHIVKISNLGVDQFELWKCFYDLNDELYPMHHFLIENISNEKDVLIEFAKNKFPLLYNPFDLFTDPYKRY